MAKKSKTDAASLEKMGAARLAALLIEIGEENPAVKRRLRLELAGAQGVDSLGAETRKRLASIARARGYLEWPQLKLVAADLRLQLRIIVDRLAPEDAAQACELLWQMLDLADSLQNRCDDSNGLLHDIFEQTCDDLGRLAVQAKLASEQLADRVYNALVEKNQHGHSDGLIPALAQALGAAGLERLKYHFNTLAKQPAPQPAGKQRVVIGWSLNGPIHADEWEGLARDSMIRQAMMAIAEAQGDVDAFIAQYDAKTRKSPNIAADIARRLMAAGRLQDAWQALEAAEPLPPRQRLSAGPAPGPERKIFSPDWENTRIELLDALGRGPEAQAARWQCFEQDLSAPHLRAYLKRLPDFEDVEAEAKALAHVEAEQKLSRALAFLIPWPAVERAAALILRRAAELNGDHYEILSPGADALAGRYPLAATLMLRAMISFTLDGARSSRYKHAARHLLDCAGLATAIKDYGAWPDHAAFEADLRARHGRKSAFWSLLA